MQFRRTHLLYFVTVADEGQITRAARKLHIAQPALSQAMAQFEADVGVPLLRRHSRGVALTPAGEVLLVKARAALDAWSDAALTAQSLAGGVRAIEFGFVGAPPGLDSPDLLEGLTREHPGFLVRFRELPFPSTPTSGWLADVDLAVCHLPPEEPGVWTQVLRQEPRAVLAGSSHPVADKLELTVADVIDEPFIGFRPSVDPDWAAFWSLDEYRGGPPRELSPDHVSNAYEVLAALSVRAVITTVPESVARIFVTAAPGVASVPLVDAEPATIVLAGREDRAGPQVAELPRVRPACQ